MATHEATLNVALGEVLGNLRPHSWRVYSEETRTLQQSQKRPDILIEEAAQWPVVIEAERSNRLSAESDARERLGQVVNETGKQIESVIALVYPQSVLDLGGQPLRDELGRTDRLEYALLTRTIGGGVERLPAEGWLRGSAKDLAMLAHRAAMPAPRVERLGEVLEHGIDAAAHRFTMKHGSRGEGELGPLIAALLGQADDQGGQTRRMAMTVLINALIFHEALAEAGFRVERDDTGEQPQLTGRIVRTLAHFRQSGTSYDRDGLTDEWNRILAVNYWPIFATAREILLLLPGGTAGEVLAPLWNAANRLVQEGVTKSHDLTGVIFQRLIADRKFLATFYTRPAAAALLAGLAIPADRAPGGAQWGDEETISALQIGDFACGTGTLLSAAYQRVSLLHELNGGDPRTLHAPMMKHGLVGLDVLNIAVHLTAASLAGAHPDVPFDGECLLTMPYGGESASIGSLELLAKHVSPDMIDQAAAVTAGGRKPEDVADLMTRIGHGQFDLVIMNPPYTAPTNPEQQDENNPIPSFAAFETTEQQQQELSGKLSALTRTIKGCAHGNAGLATNFLDLAHLKTQAAGSIAFVLPLSAMTGKSWEKTRGRLVSDYSQLLVITIAESGSKARAFSNDTSNAECLIVAKRDHATKHTTHGQFLLLASQPVSVSKAMLIAEAVQTRICEGTSSMSRIQLGDEYVGILIATLLHGKQPWPIAGVRDVELISCASALSDGNLLLLGQVDTMLELPMALIQEIGNRGPVDRDIKEDVRGGTIRGPFEIHKPALSPYPTIPVLWGHSAEDERQLVIKPDAEGIVRKVKESDQSTINKNADRMLATASRVHFNRDFQFNAHSFSVALTQRKCMGGQAWPTISLHNETHELVFVLWSNSTLGLMLYWWNANKRQRGRGNIGVSRIPEIPTLDTRALSDEQHAEAKRQFELLRNERFLPFDQIDEDPARAKLDRAILVDVLGLPESLVAPDGPIDLIRRKLAREPQIHGGKKSRVVFTDEGEKSVKRDDRG